MYPHSPHSDRKGGRGYSRPRSNLAWLWQNQELSTLSLVLTVAPTNSAATQGPHSLSANALPFNPNSPKGLTFPVHDTVLASASQYFRARILRWDGNSARSREDGFRSRAGRDNNSGHTCSRQHSDPQYSHSSGGGTTRPYSHGSSAGPGGGRTSRLQQQQQQQQQQGGGGYTGSGQAALARNTAQAAAYSAMSGAPSDAAGGIAEGGLGPGVNGGFGFAARQELLEPCNRLEMTAAQDVLEFMYTNQLTKPYDISHLLTMCILADRWDVPDCIDACMEALTWHPQQHDRLSAEHISAITADQPASVTNHALYPKLLQMCAVRVRTMFSPVHTVLPDPERLSAFCSLSFAALKLWAQDSCIVTDSENSIAVLITYWWHAQQTIGYGAPTESQLKELTCLLRLRHVSSTFLVLVVPELPWFRPPSPDAVKLLQALTQYSGTSRPNEKLVQKLPGNWMANMRMPADITKAHLEWVLSKEELMQVVSEVVPVVSASHGRSHELAGPSMYWGGFVWQILLHFSCPPGAQGCEVLLGWRVLSALDLTNLCSLAASAANRAALGLRSGAPNSAHSSNPSSPTTSWRQQQQQQQQHTPRSSSSFAGLSAHEAGGPGSSSTTTGGQPYSSGNARRNSSSSSSNLNCTGGQVGDFGSSGNDAGGGFAAYAELGAASVAALEIPICETVAAKVTLSCKEAATGANTRRYTVDAMGGMCCHDIAGRPNFFGTAVAGIDDLAPWLVQDRLQLSLQLDSFQ